MTNLYEIDKQMELILSEATDEGEFDVEAWEALQGEKKEKQHNIVRFIHHLKLDQDLLKQEIERLKKLKDMAEKREEWLKKYLGQSMQIDGVDKLDLTTHKCAFRNTPPRLEIEDEANIPTKYIKTEVVKKVDKDAIKQDLKAGDLVAGCSLVSEKRLYIS